MTYPTNIVKNTKNDKFRKCHQRIYLITLKLVDYKTLIEDKNRLTISKAIHTDPIAKLNPGRYKPIIN